MSKKSKHLVYDDPTAFGKRWPSIRQVEQYSGASLLAKNEKAYRMGKILATVLEPGDGAAGYFMTVRCNNRYPEWDEIVWMRYNLIPDAAVMVLVLPNLNRYINREDTGHKFVFTMEQQGWALDPAPTCCNAPREAVSFTGSVGMFACQKCRSSVQIDMNTWNEQHGNGFAASSGLIAETAALKAEE